MILHSHHGTETEWLINVPINHGKCNVMISIFRKTISLLIYRFIYFFGHSKFHSINVLIIICSVFRVPLLCLSITRLIRICKIMAEKFANLWWGLGEKKAMEKNVDSWFWFYLWNKYFPILAFKNRMVWGLFY